jgi:hypothetical protein
MVPKFGLLILTKIIIIKNIYILLGRAVGILFGDQCMREEGFAETLRLQDSTSLIAWSATNNIHRIR